MRSFAKDFLQTMLIGICIIPLGILSVMLTNQGVDTVWALYAPIAGGVVIYLGMRGYFESRDRAQLRASQRHATVTTDSNTGESYGDHFAVYLGSQGTASRLVLSRTIERDGRSGAWRVQSRMAGTVTVVTPGSVSSHHVGNTASNQDLVGV